MTLLRWAIRTAARSSLDTIATALDAAASALHRAAGEPDRVAELEAERLAFLYEFDYLKARGDRMRDAARAANRERRSLLEENFDLVTMREHETDRAEEAERLLGIAELDRDQARRERDEALRQLQDEQTECQLKSIAAAEAGRVYAETIRERDEARAEADRLRQVAREWGALSPVQPDQGGAG